MSKALKNKIKLNDYVSVKDFGAVGDGTTDDTAAIQAAFDYSSLTGITCLVPAGTYLITNKIETSVTASLSIKCDPSAVFKVGSTFPADTQVFVAIAAATGEHKFIWKNGTIDGRLMPAKVGVSAPDLLSVAGSTMKDTLIDNVSFLLNDVLASNRGDSCLFLTEGQNYTVSNCFFKGAVDAAIYVSGNAAQTTGRKVFVTGNTFEMCNVAYISKRSFEDQIISGNFVVECNFGIIVGGESDASLLPGKKTIITSNLLKKVQSPIAIRVSDGSVVSNNRIEDVGVGPDLTPSTSRGIYIQGSKRCVVANNYIGMASFVAAINSEGVRIESFTFNSITYSSDNNLIEGNVIFDLPRGIFEAGGANSNVISLTNSYISCIAPVSLAGALTISGAKLVGLTPILDVEIPSGATNQKRWRITTQETQFSISARNDDGTSAGVVLGANRASGLITQLFTNLGGVPSYADDIAAAVGGVPIGGFYRTASAVKIRVI